MNELQFTYGDLFDLLESLGFSSSPDGENRILHHEATQTILGFRRNVGDLVTSADLLSTEVHLSARGIIDRPLEPLVASWVSK